MSELIGLLNSAGEASVGFAGRMLVQSSLLIVALAILDLVLRKRVKAVVRYWIWLLVLAKLILPPSFSSPTGLVYWVGDKLPSLPKQVEAIIEEQPVLPPIVAADWPVVSSVPVRSVPARASLETPYGVTTNASPIQVTEEASGQYTAAVAVPSAPSITWQAALLLAWAVVVLVMVILLIQRALFVRSLVAVQK